MTGSWSSPAARPLGRQLQRQRPGASQPRRRASSPAIDVAAPAVQGQPRGNQSAAATAKAPARQARLSPAAAAAAAGLTHPAAAPLAPPPPSSRPARRGGRHWGRETSAGGRAAPATGGRARPPLGLDQRTRGLGRRGRSPRAAFIRVRLKRRRQETRQSLPQYPLDQKASLLLHHAYLYQTRCWAERPWPGLYKMHCKSAEIHFFPHT